MRRRHVLSVAVAVLAMTIAPSGLAYADKAEPAREGLAQCLRTFQSGVGNTFFKWCFHANGTLGYLEAPVNQRQIYGDNFVICSDNNTVVHGRANSDAGSFSVSGLNPPTFPNLSTVVQRTSNGRFEIKEVFSQNASEKNIFIDVTVKNLLASPIAGVTFSRVIDFDLNNSSSGDLWIRSYASVLAAENNAVSLTGSTWPIARLSQIEAFGPSVVNCRGVAAPSPSTGDFMGRVNYNLGTIGGGASKTFRYRVAQL